MFPLFDRVAGAFLQEGLVVSTWPLCSVGKETSWHHQKNKVWDLGFTCLCGDGLLALSSKLKMLVGSKSKGLESSDAQGSRGPEVCLY
jgi:hypothetical protein